MSQLQGLVIAAVITIIVILFAIFDADAGTTVKYAPRLDTSNAQRYADWCGGYVQEIPVRGGVDVSVEGCDR